MTTNTSSTHHTIGVRLIKAEYKQIERLATQERRSRSEMLAVLAQEAITARNKQNRQQNNR